MRASLLVGVLVTVLLAAPPAAGQAPPPTADVVVTLVDGTPPLVIVGADVVTNLTEERGERVRLELNVTAFTVVEVRVRGWFDVDRPRQVVPTFNDTFFTPVVRDPSDSDGTALLHNATGRPPDFTIRLGIPALSYDGVPWPSRDLVLARDVAPPTFEVGEPTNVTHFSFLARTTTSEYGFGDLRVRGAGGGEEVPNPTTVLALEQTFPVQGLDPATTYSWHVVFTDWAGNSAKSRPFLVTTAPKPSGPLPFVTELLPPRGAKLASPPDQIGARVSSPESPIAEGGVRLFVDKTEIPDGFTFESGLLRWTPPEPLAPGVHSVGVEAMNVAGGLGVATWTFEVQKATPLGLAPLALAVTLALAARRRL